MGNLFTKEELMHIGDAILYSMTILEERKDSLMSIRGKILEMIESYCHHDWQQTYTEREVCRCTKCGEEAI